MLGERLVSRRMARGTVEGAMPKSHLLKALILMAFGVHVVWVSAAWDRSVQMRHGRDFASYYYAAKVMQDGGNPYSKDALAQSAKQDRTRSTVHPYLYPPPFLLLMEWTRPLSLQSSYRIWFWLGELAALAALLTLCRWVRPLGPGARTLGVVTFCLCTAVPNNLAMGQANFVVLLCVLLALLCHSNKRMGLTGVFLGLGILMKMSPGLLLVFLVVERSWRAVGATLITCFLGHLVFAALYGSSLITAFYVDVLPGFASGQYNGLRVPIDMFGNHSLPNLWHQWFPNSGRGLSGTAQWASRLSSLLLVGVTCFFWRRAAKDSFFATAQWSSVLLLMLLFPVYTYEHHLIWALPAVLVMALAVIQGRTPRVFIPLILVSCVGWGISLAMLKRWTKWWVHSEYPVPIAWMLQEWKTFSCIVLWIGIMGLMRHEMRSADLEGNTV